MHESYLIIVVWTCFVCLRALVREWRTYHTKAEHWELRIGPLMFAVTLLFASSIKFWRQFPILI